jgi:hypothetical protein
LRVPETTDKPPPRAEVLKVRPALLRDRNAAEYLARSASWISQKRAYDLKAKREGRDATEVDHHRRWHDEEVDGDEV